jgi:hypothetical protein
MSKTRMIVRAAIIVAALSTATAAVAAGVSLPAKANSHAVSATANVTTGSSNSSHGQSDVHPASTPSPNANAAFGQCVSANAKTASDHKADHGTGADGWNPTVGCTNPNAGGANASSNSSATTGLANAETHADSHASTGLQKASTESATGQAHAH